MSAERLTIAQQRFVEAYATSYNVADALASAGYAQHHSTDSKLLKKLHIQAAIEERQKHIREEFHLEREHLVQMLLDTHEKAESVSDEIKAARQIGLMLGLYADPR